MMITSQMVNHKRQLHDGFVFSKGHNDGSGEKRLKHDGGAEANISTRKKDKIGERVTKLQQLVSPFGKSDTASVLSEAAEYIRFLHDQIQHLMQLSALQVLSAPYLQTTVTGSMEDGDCYSLRGRGLCLMPIASTLTIAQSNGADIWAPVNSNRSP